MARGCGGPVLRRTPGAIFLPPRGLAAFSDATVYVESTSRRPPSRSSVRGLVRKRRRDRGTRTTPSSGGTKGRRGMLSPPVTPTLRAPPRAAVAAAKAVGYVNAGTVEFLLLLWRVLLPHEKNTRLQVEHPVTEEAFGVTRPPQPVRPAAGSELPSAPSRHAMRRASRRDPRRISPQTGRVLLYRDSAARAYAGSGPSRPGGRDALTRFAKSWPGATRGEVRRRSCPCLKRDPGL